MATSWQVWLGTNTGLGGDASVNSNVFRQTYVNGFVDISGATTIRSDMSLNGNLYIGPNKVMGLGITSPAVTLDISGSQRIRCGTAIAGNSVATAATTNGLVLSSVKSGNYAMALGLDYEGGYGYLNAYGNSTNQDICLQTTGGYVGIGTTDAKCGLHVIGNPSSYNINGNYASGGFLAGPKNTTYTIASFTNYVEKSNDEAKSSQHFLEFGAANTDVGLPGSVYRYQLAFNNKGGANGGDLAINSLACGASYTTNVDPVNRLTIQAVTGNVGIGGNTNPGVALDVSGQIRASTGLLVTSGGITSTTGTSTVNGLTALTGTSGNVGIQNVSPGVALDVTGQVRASTGVLVTSGGITTTTSTSRVNAITALTGTNGNVGINNTSPAYALDVTGQMNVAGNVIAGNLTLPSGGIETFSTGTGVSTFVNNAGATIVPNSTAATSASWTANSVNWTVLASSTIANTFAYQAFDATNSTNLNRWGAATVSYSTSSPFAYTPTTYTTPILLSGSSTNVNGEWLQISSSTALCLNSFAFTPASTTTLAVGESPKTFYIVGATVASPTTWTPIIYGTFTALPYPTSSSQVSTPTYIVTGGSGSGTQGVLNTTTYGNATGAFTYFRLVVTNLIGTLGGATTDGNLWLGEWTLGFKNQSTGVSQASLTMDSTNFNQLNVSASILSLLGGINVNGNMNVAGTVNPSGGLSLNSVQPASSTATQLVFNFPGSGQLYLVGFSGIEAGIIQSRVYGIFMNPSNQQAASIFIFGNNATYIQNPTISGTTIVANVLNGNFGSQYWRMYYSLLFN